MSATPVVPAAPAPAPKLNAIQVVEREIANFIKQREQAIANVHAVDGAIQAAQHLRSMLVAEASKAEAFVKKELKAVEAEVESLVSKAEPEAAKVETAVVTEAETAATDVKDTVVSIDKKL